LLKSVHIYGSYRKIKTGVPFFGTSGSRLSKTTISVTFSSVSLYSLSLLKLNDIALPDKSSQSYDASLALWDHTVLPSTRDK